MKHLYYLATAGIFLLCACTNDPIEGDGVKTPGQQTGNITFSGLASHTPNTRVALDGEMAGIEITEEAGTRTTIGDDGLTAHWHADDLLNVYVSVDEGSYAHSPYAIASIDSETGAATFLGDHSWGGSEGTPHHFYAYYAGGSVNTDIWKTDRLYASLPATQTQAGAGSDHIGNYSLMVAEPVSVEQPAGETSPPALQLKFHHAFSMIEFRFNTTYQDMKIEYIELESNSTALAGENIIVWFELNGQYGYIPTVLNPSNTLRLDIDHSGGDALVPEFATGSYFSARVLVLPLNHSGGNKFFTIRVKTDKREEPYTFTRNGARLQPGYRYTITDFIPSGEAGPWTGNITEPVIDPNNANTYLISTGEELAWVAQQVNGGNKFEDKTLKQTRDIDLANREWTPIGRLVRYFHGAYDGGGFSVVNLNVNWTEQYSGLFGYVNTGGTVKNLNVTGTVSGGLHTAGVCGCNNYGTISNCTFSGAVTGSGNVGGVCGNNSGGTIAFCRNEASVEASESGVGGVCGNNGSNGSTYGCSNTGAVTCNSDYTGGICGHCVSGSITACRNTGSVSGVEQTGGICGNSTNSSVIACYNTGEVTGTARGTGGVCGSGKATACYNTGRVTGTTYVGGVCGIWASTSCCYWGIGAAALDCNGSGTDNGSCRFGDDNGDGGVRWPSEDAAKGWGVHIDDATTPPAEGYYWQSLGAWNAAGDPAGSASTLPKLYWEE
ncbi:fimbrillin family protein [uncultured Alistipes sp.]|uniref:fimbrillin family protein n=1 Tax=uncultured Alistipes sp. TaxID=538949 RepID=UPI0025CD23D5|nr:fimbrillin family protein [uncultured Alistipes sp.]